MIRRRQAGLGLPGIAAIMVALLAVGFLLIVLVQRPHRQTSVVLIVLDTVRPDHLTPYGYRHDTTPRLRALAEEGLLFEQARAVAPWTLPSHASLFTGLLPSQHGCHWEHRWLVDRHETVAESAARAGYETFGVTTNANASSLYHLDQGFATFLETWRLRDRNRGLDDSALANAEIHRWLDARDGKRPFFLFVNYADAHLPYAPPPPLDALFGAVTPRARELAGQPDLLQQVLAGKVTVGPAEAEGLGRLYDGELRKVDGLVGELLDLLDGHGAAEDTLVIVTSDHGEFLGEEGRVDHQLSLREELLRVPLILRWPGRVRPGRIPEPVALTAIKGWIDEAVADRLPAWSPAPDRLPAGFVAEYFRPVDLIDLVRGAGADPAAIDRRQACLYQPLAAGASKLLVATPGGSSFWRLTGGKEELTEVPAGELAAATALLEQLRSAPPGPFAEGPADLMGVATGAAADPGALADLRRIGYVGARTTDATGVHAAEHWAAGVHARARGEFDLARAELERALALAPDEPALRQELARTLEAAGQRDR